MKKTPRKRANIKAIKRLRELLPDVLDSFGWYGIGTPSVTEPASGAPQPEPHDESAKDEEEDEEYEEPEYYVDPADVQGAVDEAVSTLINEGLIQEFKNPKEPPGLSDIFTVLFPRRSKLIEQAEYFEELISGYADQAHVDDLQEAYNILESILDEIGPHREG
jgi:hypothetical protein